MTTSFPPRPAGPLAAASVFTRRYLLQLRRSPDLIAISIMQPILFMLVFAFVLGGAIDTPAASYTQYLLPGLLVQTAAFIALGSTSAGLAEELAHGAVERYRTMPAGAVGMLVGRTVGDLARTCATLVIVLVLGVALGLRIRSEPAELVIGLGLLVLASWAFCWIGATFALATRSAEAPQFAALIVLFPLTFASSAYVPTGSMPSWLATFAAANPITALVDTVRAAFGGTDVAGSPLLTLAWSAGLLLLTMPIALVRLNRWGHR